jgi:hypothetical protein
MTTDVEGFQLDVRWSGRQSLARRCSLMSAANNSAVFFNSTTVARGGFSAGSWGVGFRPRSSLIRTCRGRHAHRPALALSVLREYARARRWKFLSSPTR